MEEWYICEGTICPGCRGHFGIFQDRSEENGDGDKRLTTTDFSMRGWTLETLRYPEKKCINHKRIFLNEKEGGRHIRDAHTWCPHGHKFAWLCLACKRVVWQSDGETWHIPDLSCKSRVVHEDPGY